MLSRRAFLASTLATPLIAQSRPKYNVLMIAVDDLMPRLGCYGDSRAKSPNIDRLASQGLIFTKAYCQQAVCSPSRTSLMLGLRPDTTKIYELQTHFRKILPDAVSLAQHFKNNGYTTSGFGKIYHNGGFPPQGLDDPRSWSIPAYFYRGPEWNTPANAARQGKYLESLKESNYRWSGKSTPRNRRRPSWESPDVADDEMHDGAIANRVIRAMEELRDKPFFLAAGFIRPHLPFTAPKKYFDMYPPGSIPLATNPAPPENAPAVALHRSGELRTYPDIPEDGPIPEDKARDLVRAYYASMSYMDAQVGRLLDALDRLQLREKTVVVLWGDHGYHLGDHGLWNKHTNFENAARVPLIISVPGQKSKGRKTGALAEFVDIYPTLTELCGLPKRSELEGTSFVPVIDNPDRKWKSAAFSQYPRRTEEQGAVMGYSMRTDRYRYTEWSAPDKEPFARELYDHEKDPQENTNVAGDPANAALVARLSKQLRAGWKQAKPK